MVHSDRGTTRRLHLHADRASPARNGYSGLPGAGANRWPAAHTLDAARVFQLALEKAPAGSRLHAVGRRGHRGARDRRGHRPQPRPARQVGFPAEEIPEYFQFLATFIGLDENLTSSARTRELLGWEPTHPRPHRRHRRRPLLRRRVIPAPGPGGLARTRQVYRVTEGGCDAGMACGPARAGRDRPGRPLTARDTPVPEPGPGELLLRVLACGVCRTDLHVTEGDLPVHRPGVTPGHEVVGEVVATGPGDAAGFATGDRAGAAWLRSTDGTCRYCARGAENLCPSSAYTGWDADGGYAEYLTVPAAYAHPLPRGTLTPSSRRCCARASSATGR